MLQKRTLLQVYKMYFAAIMYIYTLLMSCEGKGVSNISDF